MVAEEQSLPLHVTLAQVLASFPHSVMLLYHFCLHRLVNFQRQDTLTKYYHK